MYTLPPAERQEFSFSKVGTVFTHNLHSINANEDKN